MKFAIEVEIRRMRLRNGWTQAYLGNVLGVRQATISRIESNAEYYSWGIISKILIALEVEVQDIKGFTQDFVLKESDFELFIKILMASPKLKTSILYNPIYYARVIINDHNTGIINFNEQYTKK